MKCPAGHESASTDYCDTCGLAMGDPAVEAVDAPSTGNDAGHDHDTGQLPVSEPMPTSTGKCPNCRASNPANALFCEACGYDFTTGAIPRPADPSSSSLDLPAASDPSTPANPSPAPKDSWVAEVWIDPDWYADQQSTDPLPSPGLPSVVALRHSSILIGRTSRSRGISPDLDLGSDSGISRRHAQLTTDGKRWFVEDLGSSNGTYVGGSVGGLPKDPIAVGKKREIDADDRVYLGAWTRLVIRKAAPGEVS